MASIRKRDRKDGTVCHAVLFHIDGRQSSLPFDDPKAAEAFKAAVEVHGAGRALEMYRIDPAPRRHSPADEMTVAGWVRHHIDHLTGLEQKTLDDYERHLRLDIGPFLGDIPLIQLAEEDVASWIKHLESTPRAKTRRVPTAKTIANIHGFLSGALEAAVRRKRIPSNPCAHTRLPGRTTEEGTEDQRLLSRDEFNRLQASFTAHWHPFLEFLVVSGCRWSEATALKPAHVDRATGVVRIRDGWKYDSTGYHLGKLKSKRSRRDINISAATLDKLDYSSKWLFVNTKGNPIRYHSFRSNVWDHSLALTNLDPKPTPHDLRHTCASWMLNAGIPITTVSRHLGHENISTTVNIYGHLDRTSAAAAADVMGKLLK